MSSTIASRRPIKRLIKVDLPTLGRPRIATIGRPSKERSFRSSQTHSTVSSSVKSVESINTASIAFARGDTVREESTSSRALSDALTFSALVLTSADLRTARALKSACKYIFSAASGATTVPISRPSTTIPRSAPAINFL